MMPTPSGMKLEAEDHVQEVKDDVLSLPPDLDEWTEESLHEPSWAGIIVVGVFLIILGIGVTGISAGLGVGFVFIGIVMVVGGATSAGKEGIDAVYERSLADQFVQTEEEGELEDAIQARKVARQQEVEEIIRAVKQTIRIRCRYCGTLNEEKANKCESCGASL